MIIFVADTARDQEMLDKFQRAYENLKKIVDRLEDGRESIQSMDIPDEELGDICRA